jgi:hypothetical protein
MNEALSTVIVAPADLKERQEVARVMALDGWADS